MSKILSIILGFLLAYLIIKYLKKNIHGPNSKDITGKIFKFDDKYYKFDVEICVCPIRL